MKRIIALLLAASLLLGAAAAGSAQSALTEDDWEVEQLDDGTLAITGCKVWNINGPLVIPETLFDITVTKVTCNFYRRGITSVTIPDTITELYPRSLFSLNEISSFTWGRGVPFIPFYCFDGNEQLTTVVIPDWVIVVQQQAFSSCRISSLDLGKVQRIGIKAFSENKITRLDLPPTLTRIWDEAFAENEITTLVIPEGVTYVGTFAFGKNPLTSLVIPASLAGREYDEENSELVAGISSNAFKCETLTRVTLPDNMAQRNMDIAGFDKNLITAWQNQGKKGGTYVKRGPIWSLGQ